VTDVSNQQFKSGHKVLTEVSKAIFGKDDIILRVLLAILARGHILLEDIPGVGKTPRALAFSKAINVDYNPMQFSPDVLPSDIVGFSIFDKESSALKYTPGVVMCNLFLADELNRATSRTQSALLEAMEERQVTVDGVSHALPRPFIVIATQNPVGAAGTQLLPDSQMDRFMLRLSLGYPAQEDELSLLKRKQDVNLLDQVEVVLAPGQLEQMQGEVDQVYIDQSILNYIVRLMSETRHHPNILMGASPRASVALSNIAKALAYLQGRDYVIPKDIPPLFRDVISHRLVLRAEVEIDDSSADKILSDILSSTYMPVVS
jgi:MoxR-like ATPase